MRAATDTVEKPKFDVHRTEPHPKGWATRPTPFQFTGKEHDQHGYFNAHYFGARYYDDRLGMFTSVDPAGQFVSAYVYGGNNPFFGVDPDGPGGPPFRVGNRWGYFPVRQTFGG